MQVTCLHVGLPIAVILNSTWLSNNSNDSLFCSRKDALDLYLYLHFCSFLQITTHHVTWFSFLTNLQPYFWPTKSVVPLTSFISFPNFFSFLGCSLNPHVLVRGSLAIILFKILILYLSYSLHHFPIFSLQGCFMCLWATHIYFLSKSFLPKRIFLMGILCELIRIYENFDHSNHLLKNHIQFLLTRFIKI